MSIITIITIVLNICQCYFLSHGSRVMVCIILDCCPVIPRLSCAAVRDRPLCIRCTSVYLPQICLCVCVNECLKWVRFLFCCFFSSSSFSSSFTTGAGLLSEAGLCLGDVDFDAVCAFRGGVLPYRRRTLRRHQPLSGFLPLLVHGRVHAPVLPRGQLGLGLLLWHRRWKLLVFILRKSCQEGRGVRYGEERAINSLSAVSTG